MSTARAHPNIALIKYWGKADDELMLPAAPSVSLTLDIFPTTTTARLAPTSHRDRLILNGQEASEKALARVERVLDVIRDQAGRSEKLLVISDNEAPTGAGMASSASGFAALALAAATEYGMDVNTAQLSRLARRGSGSAARSVISGVALWHAGTDEESFAEEISAPPLAMVSVVLNTAHKKITSREAMVTTRATSPYYCGWVESTRDMAAQMVDACKAGDMQRIGELTELSALRMHALIMSSEPPIHYLTSASWRVFELARTLRGVGLDVYATADAGPNVVLLTRPELAAEVARHAEALGKVSIAHAGNGAYLVEEPESHREVL
ncbi:diphosphomevalonate decarboxylase [Actinotignum sanguinis]|uniref:diphosphomevalonate decarboxylase n=3 Tax=Actinomycetaceae TaxID=2049 RepID=A0ABZ0RDH9_9ACTO|nr:MULTISPECIES: diphosphomevalonate decarboxylase [Actinotignum]WPJ89278.1 diphosphomevalonate decarboxylase [Schaalia turicensis]MDE1654063.1 diphosphomevalonate decarboxylase [Actinotignum schaalii]MDE1656693.1 diphosphomevalonate decarboxylase [Actinotignum sanguinis]MDK8286423.1 diphosphomevalonate decarboxylase [Actinotignum sanguinis]MDK8512263.1 diphosphomevalonate decarboxylase [Actinotignum sanguinis]